MERVIYVYSSLNGALIGFKKSFEAKSSALPKLGTVIALGDQGEPKKTLKQGLVTNARVTKNSVEIKVGTEDASTEVLRDCLIQDGYEEISLPTW